MRTRSLSVAAVAAVLAALAALTPPGAAAPAQPIVYTVRITAPDTETTEVEAAIPTGKQASNRA